MLPNNLNFYITDYNNVGNFHNKNITHWFTFNQPNSTYALDLKQFGGAQVYSYQFHDVFDKSVHPMELVWPTVRDIMFIVDQANNIRKDLARGKQVNVLFNCFAGISRSTAAAYIVLCVIMGEYNERACWAEVLSKRPIARANPLMVSIADDHLNRGGKMMTPLSNCLDFLRRDADSDQSCLLF